MRYRIAEILAPEDLGISGTKVINLKISDVISRIEVIFRTQNGDDGFDDHPAANIPKLELIDGSEVLFALTGREVQAVNFADRRIPADNHMTGSNGEWMKANYGLDFGRKLYDPVLAFDPTKFTNPQLKVTWNEALANTSCSNNYLQILAYIFDEYKPTPTGFLLNKQLYSYTPTADGYEYIDLPTDLPYRKLFLGSHQEQYTFTQMIAELKLSEDNDKRVPVDLLGTELWWENKKNFPEYIENVYMNIAATSTVFRVTPSEDAVITGNPTSAEETLILLFGNGGYATGKMATTKNTCYLICKGYIPHGYAALPFGDQDLIEDWYDVTKIESLRLRIKAGPSLGATPTTQVLTQQIRKY